MTDPTTDNDRDLGNDEVGQEHPLAIGADGKLPGLSQYVFSSTPLTYAPHTLAAYRMPPSRLVYRVAVGAFTRLRYRQARRAGAAIG